jgi:hypothetical protein
MLALIKIKLRQKETEAMSIIKNADRAQENPLITEFIEACDLATKGGQITVPLIQTKPLFKYSSSLLISKWDQDRQDFLFTFCGSKIVKNYSIDLSGKYISEAAEAENVNFFITFYNDIINSNKVEYISGDLGEIGKKYLNWDQVSMPLERNGNIAEVLSLVVFNLQK